MSNELRIKVPNEHCSWDEVATFALSYNGYQRFGRKPDTFPNAMELGKFANSVMKQWQQDESLPESLHDLRCVLFFEQRRTGNGFPFDFEVQHEWENPRSDYIDWINDVKALLEAIRVIAGETIEGPADSF